MLGARLKKPPACGTILPITAAEDGERRMAEPQWRTNRKDWVFLLGLFLAAVVIHGLIGGFTKQLTVYMDEMYYYSITRELKPEKALQNNLGVIIAIVAFVPFIIIALTDKKADKKSKIIATVIAAVALLIGGLFGIDWNPISQEEMLENAHIETVFWTDSGTVYHAYDDCGHLSNTVNLNTGTSATAIENGKTRLCKSCEARAQREAEAAEENNEENKTPADTAAEANQ